MNITVIIPTYNRYDVLKRALNSVLQQSYPPYEIIIVDDGSSDETALIKEEFPEIKYIYKENGGVSSARNLGIKNAVSEWIAFLDSDDEWHEDKLKEQVQFHKENRDILISYTDEEWVRNGVTVKVPKKFCKYGGEVFEESLSHCIIAPSATLIHTKLLDEIGDFDENLEVCEDYDLWLRVALKHKIGLVDKKLITKYGGDKDQLSMKHWGMDRFRVRALEKLYNANMEHPKSEKIVTSLLQKYKLLLKGAIKYDKISDINLYKEKIDFYNQKADI